MEALFRFVLLSPDDFDNVVETTDAIKRRAVSHISPSFPGPYNPVLTACVSLSPREQTWAGTEMTPIHITQERAILSKELSRARIRFISMPATNRNLRRVTDLHCRLMHFSGMSVSRTLSRAKLLTRESFRAWRHDG